MSIEYIRKNYNLPKIKIGMPVTVHGRIGKLISTRYAYVRVRLFGEKIARSYHPKYEALKYIYR